MATYPIKMMIDESGQPFGPLTSLDAVIGEKKLQYIIDATETSAGHFNIIIKDVTLEQLKNTVVVVRWPQINSTVKPSYLQLNEEEEIILYNGSGTEYLDLEEASNTVNILAYDGEKWILTSGAGSGSGHVITDDKGKTMEQQKVLNFVGFIVVNDAANRATKIVNPTPINNLDTSESGLGSLDAYQGYILSGRSIPAGGGAGQVLSKKNDSDYQVEWIDRDSNDVVTSDGSIEKIVGITYEEYKALESAGKLEPTTQYHIIDFNEENMSFISEEEIQDTINNTLAPVQAQVNTIEQEMDLRGSCACFYMGQNADQEMPVASSTLVKFDTVDYIDNDCFELLSDGRILVKKDISRVYASASIRGGYDTDKFYYLGCQGKGDIANTSGDTGIDVCTVSGILPVYKGDIIYLSAYFFAGGKIDGFNCSWVGIHLTVLR